MTFRGVVRVKTFTQDGRQTNGQSCTIDMQVEVLGGVKYQMKSLRKTINLPGGHGLNLLPSAELLRAGDSESAP
jgi:hypothetical protein